MTTPVDPRAFIAWCRENRPSGESVWILMELADTASYARHPHDETLRLCDMAELRLDLADARAQVEDWKRMHALGEVSERQAIAHFTAQVATLESSLSASRAALRGAEDQARSQVAERGQQLESQRTETGRAWGQNVGLHSTIAMMGGVREQLEAQLAERDATIQAAPCAPDCPSHFWFCPVCGARSTNFCGCLDDKPDQPHKRGRCNCWKAESLPAAVAGHPPCNRCGCPALNHCGTGCLSGSRTSSACTCPLTLTQVIAQGAPDGGPPQSTSELEALREEVERLKSHVGALRSSQTSYANNAAKLTLQLTACQQQLATAREALEEFGGHLYPCAWEKRREDHCMHCKKVKNRHYWDSGWAPDGTCKDDRGRPELTKWSPRPALDCDCGLHAALSALSPSTATASPRPVLASFLAYLSEHPEQRVWQALRNWSGYAFVLLSQTRDGGTLDTFGLPDDWLPESPSTGEVQGE